ncbi:hypothetical protein ACFXTI_029426 [Malus domestica]
MTRLEKLPIAHQLAKLRVDVIEVGFPASSKYDWETVKLIAKEVGSRVDKCSYVPVISAYCRNLGAHNITFACENARKPTFGSGDSSLQLVKLSFNRVSGDHRSFQTYQLTCTSSSRVAVSRMDSAIAI